MAAQDTGAREAPQHDRSLSARLRRRFGGRTGEPPQQPWRVEGDRTAGQPGSDRPGGRRGWARIWWLWLALLAVNRIIASVMLSPEPRAQVAYTFFLSQVSATNVGSITSTGESIEGDLKNPVSYTPPQGGDAPQVTRSRTQRPTFANDNLFQQLQSSGVPVNANPPDAGAPVWQQLLFGFGPTLLLVWLLVSATRRMGGSASEFIEAIVGVGW